LIARTHPERAAARGFLDALRSGGFGLRKRLVSAFVGKQHLPIGPNAGTASRSVVTVRIELAWTPASDWQVVARISRVVAARYSVQRLEKRKRVDAFGFHSSFLPVIFLHGHSCYISPPVQVFDVRQPYRHIRHFSSLH
jgi:hypothetical protein